MINFTLVKHLKTKRIVAIATLICGLASGCIAGIAFAGRTPGSFVINLKQQNIKLVLDDNRNFDNPSTYLKIADSPKFDVTNNERVSAYDDRLDDEITNHVNLGSVEDALTGDTKVQFFKYTFYVKNSGTTAADFTMTVNITDNVKPTNTVYGYDDFLRVRVYSNDGKLHDAHEYKTYAKRAMPNNSLPPEANGREPISHKPGSPEFVGYADMFASEKTICVERVEGFLADDVQRFTIVCWLEGNDPECTGAAPHGGSLKLGIKIDGQKKYVSN